MADVLRDAHFVTYFVVANIVLVALAAAGPAWFVTGLCAFAGNEVVTSLRTSPATCRSRV